MKVLTLLLYASFKSVSALGMPILDYEIVTQDDLDVDKWLGGYNAWNCFPVANASIKYRVWTDRDQVGPGNLRGEMCDVVIVARYSGETHEYCARRAHPAEYCREMARRWKKLTQGESIVCVNGDELENDKRSTGNLHSHVFEKFKTRKGCYANFNGYCDISYWREQGFPKRSVK